MGASKSSIASVAAKSRWECRRSKRAKEKTREQKQREGRRTGEGERDGGRGEREREKFKETTDVGDIDRVSR